MSKYKWYAKFKFGGYLYLEDGDAEGGICAPIAYVGDKPTLFRTKEACRERVREWPKGSFIIIKKED